MKFNVKRHAVVQPLNQSIRVIPLTQGKNAIVDAEDYDWLSQWNWQAWEDSRGHWYAKRGERGKSILMHRQILKSDSAEIDHKNRDTLDNRRTNLRGATVAQNQWNTGRSTRNRSGHKGVSWSSRQRRWVVQAVLNNKSFYLGSYYSKQIAARVYDDFCESHHGAFKNSS